MTAGARPPELPLALAPVMSEALTRWLDSERAARDRSDHTIRAYQADLLAFLSFLGSHHGAPALPATLAGLTQTDMRAFAAAERARGRSARSLARRLSAIDSWPRERWRKWPPRCNRPRMPARRNRCCALPTPQAN